MVRQTSLDLYFLPQPGKIAYQFTIRSESAASVVLGTLRRFQHFARTLGGAVSLG